MSIKQSNSNKKNVIAECLFYILLFILLLQLIGRFIPSASTLSWQSLSSGAFMCMATFVMLISDKKAVLLIKPDFNGALKTGWYIVAASFIFLIFQLVFVDVLPSAKNLLMFAFSALFTAISEELLFRGLISYRLKMELGEKESTIIISAALFALTHLSNLISAPSMVLSALTQTVYTFSIGMMLTYSYFKTENLMVPILQHFLFNALSSFSSAAFPAADKMQDIGITEVVILLAVMVPGIFWTHKRIRRPSNDSKPS